MIEILFQYIEMLDFVKMTSPTRLQLISKLLNYIFYKNERVRVSILNCSIRTTNSDQICNVFHFLKTNHYKHLMKIKF